MTSEESYISFGEQRTRRDNQGSGSLGFVLFVFLFTLYIGAVVWHFYKYPTVFSPKPHGSEHYNIKEKLPMRQKKREIIQPVSVPRKLERSTVSHSVVARPKLTTTDTRYGIGSHENMGIGDAVAALVATTRILKPLPDKGKSLVVKQKSNVDGKSYFVADDLPHKQKAANKLAEITRRSQYLLQAIDEQLDGNRRIKSGDGQDITDNMKTLVRKHYKRDIPLAEYHAPNDETVGSNTDKGVLIETCLRSKYNAEEWNSDNTLFRVHLHELAHSADFEFRGDGELAHGEQFKRLHQYLLTVAENLGLYSCAEYKKSKRHFCGLSLTENYCGGGGGVVDK
jgi:hypothetical protein